MDLQAVITATLGTPIPVALTDGAANRLPFTVIRSGFATPPEVTLFAAHPAGDGLTPAWFTAGLLFGTLEGLELSSADNAGTENLPRFTPSPEIITSTTAIAMRTSVTRAPVKRFAALFADEVFAGLWSARSALQSFVPCLMSHVRIKPLCWQDPEYAEIARRRFIGDCPLFAEVTTT